jgi:phosphoribosylglycinamide formyltransferase-1
MAQGFQATGQGFGIAKHGWQDGQMGHGAMPALADPSDHGSGVQWPLPQDWPSTRQPLRLGVMASGEGSNFEALAESCRTGWAEIVLLVVNNDQCGAQRRAERLGIPTTLIDHRLYPKREDLDRALIQVFQQQQVDLVAMAGWMRIVTPLLIQAYPGRLVNIHPSLLPSFPGVDGVGQALAAGVTLSGCTAHLVCEEVDAGEILVQASVPVLKTDDHASLGARIQRHEHNILPLAIALAAQKLGL